MDFIVLDKAINCFDKPFVLLAKLRSFRRKQLIDRDGNPWRKLNPSNNPAKRAQKISDPRWKADANSFDRPFEGCREMEQYLSCRPFSQILMPRINQPRKKLLKLVDGLEPQFLCQVEGPFFGVRVPAYRKSIIEFGLNAQRIHSSFSDFTIPRSGCR